MAQYDYSPTHLNGVALTGGNLKCYFRRPGGPMQTRPIQPVVARIPGLGDRDVRGQPRGITWDMHVELTATDETDLDTFYDTFNEEDGLVYLRADDGDGANWRVQVRVRQIRSRSLRLAIVRLYVPQPIWEQNSATASSEDNKSGASFNWSMTNAGSRQARPTFTITPTTAKTNTVDDYWGSLRGFVVNQSPNAIIDKPVQLFDNGGGSATLNHGAHTPAHGLANADDLRVWINDIEVDRWIEGADTATAECWVNLTMPGSVTKTLVTAMADASTPADGANVELVEGVADLPERGQVAIELELITYQSRDIAAGTIQTIERGAWGTTAAGHTTAKVVYKCDILYVCSTGKSSEGAAPAPAERRPAIELTSKNSQWNWGDQAADANTIFYSSATPTRTAMWQPSSEQAENDFSTPLRLEDSSNIAKWEDSAPVEGKPPTTRLKVSIPQRIGAVASAITYDIQKRSDIRLRLLGRDTEGNEIEMVDAQDVDEGSEAATAIQPAAVLEAVTLSAVRAAVTGADSESTVQTLSALLANRFQKVILDQDTEISAVQIKVKKSAGADYSFVVRLLDDTGVDPATGNIIVDFTTGSLTAGDITESAVVEEYTSPAGAVMVEAGTYWLGVAISVHAGGNLVLSSGPPTTRNNQLYESATGIYAASTSLWHRIIHEHDGPVQPDADRLNGATEASFDKLKLKFANSPFIDRNGDFANYLYHCVGVLSNAATSDTITIDKWMAEGSSLAINCEDRTVVYTEGNHIYSVPACITPSNIEDWMPLDPGGNTITYTEANMLDTTLAHTFRGRKL